MPQNDANELKHYGVLGMHWGVRKDLAATYRDSASRNAEKAKHNRTQAEIHRQNSKAIRTGPLKIGNGRKSIQQRVAAYKLDNTATAQEQKAKRMDAIAKFFEKPYTPAYEKRYNSIYHDAVKTIGIGTLAAITVALVRPTADMFGKRVANFVASKAGTKVVETSAEYAARKALGG